ncbi:MAG: hypothetical protein WCP93_04125 [Candidatus Berkelbacteria bacterium]
MSDKKPETKPSEIAIIHAIKKDEKPKTKPFGKSIIDAIKRCKNEDEILPLLKLIEETQIKSNHIAILNAIDEFFASHENTKSAGAIVSVTTSILAQKDWIDSAPERTAQIMTDIIMNLK